VTAYGNEDYLRVLGKVQKTEGHSMTYYHVSFHGVSHPDDQPDYKFFDWSKTDQLVIRAAIQKGFLSISTETDWEDHDWKSASIALTASGNDYVNDLLRPWWKRWGANMAGNIPTIFLSVFSALLISWVIYFFGAPR